MRGGDLTKSVSVTSFTSDILDEDDCLYDVQNHEYETAPPDPKVCHKLSEILKSKYPQTYRVKKVVNSSFGPLNMKRKKGEGGHRDLVHRISDNFYNKFTMKTAKKTEIEAENSEQKSASPGGKKLKKRIRSNERKI